MSDKCFSTQTLLYVSFRHVFISLASFMGDAGRRSLNHSKSFHSVWGRGA